MNVSSLIEEFCECMGVDKVELLSKSRRANLVNLRHLLAYILRIECELTYQRIGENLGKHHATVIHSETVVTDMLFIEDESMVELYKKWEERDEPKC